MNTRQKTPAAEKRILITRRFPAGPTPYQAELVVAALTLAAAIEYYHRDVDKGHGHRDRVPARIMIQAMTDWFSVMLPDADDETLASLIELSVLETARARIEQRAAAGEIPSAQVLPLHPESK